MQNFSLKQYPRTAIMLAWRDIQSRIKGTWLGLFWLIIQPLALLLVYTFVFSTILKVRFDIEGNSANFALYLFAGLLPFTAFQESVIRASTTLSDNRELLIKSTVPASLLLSSILLSNLLTEMIGLAILIIFAVIQGSLSHFYYLCFMPVLIFSRLIITLILAMLSSIISVFIRDFPPLLTMLLTMLFFATPIIYPVTMVPPTYHWLIDYNPFAVLIQAYRGILFENHLPDLSFYFISFIFLIGLILLFPYYERIINRLKDFL